MEYRSKRNSKIIESPLVIGHDLCRMENMQKYYDYPYTTDIEVVRGSTNISESFPTLTVCLNSMHAASKVLQFHKEDQILVNSLSFLYGFYTDTHNATMDEVLAELRQSAPENINDFYDKTFHPIDINQCRFLNLPCDKDFSQGSHI